MPWPCAGSLFSDLGSSPRPHQSPVMAQWGIFLRNHDELIAEMVTDEERDHTVRRAVAKD